MPHLLKALFYLLFYGGKQSRAEQGGGLEEAVSQTIAETVKN